MNREAMRRILERTRGVGPAALADPRGGCGTPGRSPAPVATLADPPKATTRPDPAPWELLTRPQDPRERLILYLDTWATMSEDEWPEANVRALYEDIMDLFRDKPEADAWFREWRQKHPEARW